MSCSTTRRAFFKDLQQLYKTIEASTDGQATILGTGEMSVRVSLRPKSGCNAHAEFILSIKCTSSYPRNCPDVTFSSPIFHPNIDSQSGSVCLSLLSEWQSCYSLLDVVKAVLYLIEHPNFESANNSLAILENPGQLSSKTARLLAGLPVNGRRFTPNTAWCEWARANGCLPTREEEVEETEESEAEAQGRTVAKEDNINEDDPANDVGSIGAPADTSTMGDEESNVDVFGESSDATSDTVPSFAKIRHSIDNQDDNRTESYYECRYIPYDVASQRILIWEPESNDKLHRNFVFYFVEILGGQHHQSELGLLYSTLFTGDVLHENQIHSEFRQTSSTCPWYPFYKNPCPSYYSYSPYSSSIQIDNLFRIDEPTKHTLTSDFCMWSALDGQGTADLFSRIFFEGERHGANFTCFLDADGDSDSESGGIRRLFDASSSDHEDAAERFSKPSDDSEKPESGTQSETSYNVADLVAETDSSPTDEEFSHSNKPAIRSSPAPSSVSSETYEEKYESYPLMRDCTNCQYDLNTVKGLVNAELAPHWKWVFRQTRWPIRFAPQQNVDLSMTDISIPPWRISVGRLLSDVCRFGAKNRKMKNLVLLDPMALSPLSPLLNLMRHSVEPRPHLTGVLWMTPLDALSPSYRVPIPITGWQEGREGEDGEEDNNPYPRAIHLRFLVITAFLANWVAWLSRVEAYTTLGISRLSPAFISTPMAACVLQPLSLGCGQTPLLDLWPLWLLRRLFTLSLRLPQLRLPFFRHRHHYLHLLFPFSTLDEI
ncbi:UBiquitin Conjugating enzyme family member [Echinococcus multilocularis]|uniref:UBiquitin Conjugating enzyme family member n=1 Tax=Echinococcus multilocularis TaxID=6211 RepID=A0A068Y596_ECHMU|nr:UBiquitin Conjugating enzyme family member [Echinococcus multilocularis]